MTPRQYIFGVATIIFGVFTIPQWLIEAFRVHVVTVVVFVSILWNFIFSLQKIREMIVKRLLADLMEELFRTEEFRNLLGNKFRQKYFVKKPNE